VVSTGAQRRERLGFSTRRLRHLQFQPHSGQERPPSTIPLTIAGTVSWGNLGETSIGVVSCAQKEDHFNCNYFLKNNTNHTGDYKYGGQLWSTKLVDNFHIDHPLIRGYFENGLGKRQDVITLGKDEWLWAVQEFAGPTKDITTVRVVFLGIGNQSVLVCLPGSEATGCLPK
jgi:hypothetical protein